MSSYCICCKTTGCYLWRYADKFRNIPAPPLDLMDSRVCYYCYVDLFDSSLEERVRDGIKGIATGPLTIVKNYLYASSHPRFPKDDPNNNHDPLTLITIGQYDSLLFSLDTKRLGFDQALHVLQTAYPHQANLIMYKTFYEGCRKRFKNHGNWYDMQRLKP